jgi:membrane-bound lytic murein transglycosylase MltF
MVRRLHQQRRHHSPGTYFAMVQQKGQVCAFVTTESRHTEVDRRQTDMEIEYEAAKALKAIVNVSVRTPS